MIQEHGGDGAEAKAARVGSASTEGCSMMIIMMISMVWYQHNDVEHDDQHFQLYSNYCCDDQHDGDNNAELQQIIVMTILVPLPCMIIMMIITIFMMTMINDDSYAHDISFLQMREAEQRLTEEQETMLGLQVEPNKSVFGNQNF